MGRRDPAWKFQMRFPRLSAEAEGRAFTSRPGRPGVLIGKPSTSVIGPRKLREGPHNATEVGASGPAIAGSNRSWSAAPASVSCPTFTEVTAHRARRERSGRARTRHRPAASSHRVAAARAQASIAKALAVIRAIGSRPAVLPGGGQAIVTRGLDGGRGYVYGVDLRNRG